VSDALFVTLDPLVRKVRLPDQRELLVSDTVGFIDRLPHALVAAFRATLEEAREADLLLHVIDASADDRVRRMAAVHTVLEEVGAANVPRIDVYNKADMVDAAERGRLEKLGEHSVVISALHAQGHADLLALVTARLGLDVQRVVLRANPDTDAGRKGMAWVYRHGRVVRHTNSQARAIIDVELPRRDVATFRETFAGSPDVRLGRAHA